MLLYFGARLQGPRSGPSPARASCRMGVEFVRAAAASPGSDEMSQVGEVEKIEAISELVDNLCGLAA